MRRWTGRWPAKNASKTPWPPGIWWMGRWCSMTCPRRRSRAGTCPLGAIGYARDGVKGRRQIVYGLLCTTAGVPVAIEVFDGNTANPKTLTAQIRKLTTGFGLSRVALVGDRGMLTSARITEELRPAHAGLAQRAARRPDQGLGGRRRAAAVAVRRAEPGGHHRPRLPRRAADRLPQPRPGRPNAPANAASCWPPPKPSSTRSLRPPAVSVSRCAARTPSGCGWAR